ncbi:unnamed protein product [Soboliphyme baturini]|uniref:DUF2156 domain-containing protein n=1 Tax=Soboliphyme baturini TaxID=241478 RepID=A0A183IME2_9BILA|nr:unnamed protein product [Soboliphyme baturini]
MVREMRAEAWELNAYHSICFILSIWADCSHYVIFRPGLLAKVLHRYHPNTPTVFYGFDRCFTDLDVHGPNRELVKTVDRIRARHRASITRAVLDFDAVTNWVWGPARPVRRLGQDSRTAGPSRAEPSRAEPTRSDRIHTFRFLRQPGCGLPHHFHCVEDSRPIAWGQRALAAGTARLSQFFEDPSRRNVSRSKVRNNEYDGDKAGGRGDDWFRLRLRLRLLRDRDRH